MSGSTTLEWITGIATASAVLVALGGYAFVEWQRRLTVRQARRTSAHMIGVRAIRLLNHFCDLERHFSKFPPMHWNDSAGLLPNIHPMVGLNFDPMVVLEKEEIALLIEANEADFLLSLMLAGSRYESIVLSFNEYRERYDELYRMTPPPAAIDGTVASHPITDSDLLRLKPYSIQLFELAGALRSMITENVELCKNLAREYHPLMKRRFESEKFISLREPEELST